MSLRRLPHDCPATEDDFCECPRGREALRWFRNGHSILPGLAEGASVCSHCDSQTGVQQYAGWHTAGGGIIFGMAFSPKVDLAAQLVRCTECEVQHVVGIGHWCTSKYAWRTVVDKLAV